MNDTQKEIPIKQIMRPKHPIRALRRNAPEYIEMLESIRKDGVLQPILVRPCDPSTGFQYEVVEGWHRYETSKECGLETIPALVKDLTDDEVLVIQLKCNAIRPVTHTFEYARRLKLLMDKGLTIVQLSQLVDKSVQWVRDQLQLNRLCEEARAPIEQGEIRMQSALALANLPQDLQPKFVDDAIALKAKDFVDRAEYALRDFKSCLQREHEADKLAGVVKPRLQAVNILKRETVKPKNAKRVLKAAGAKTALDGWRACLAWVFSIDPISVKNRVAGNKEGREGVIANQQEYRELNRSLIEQFVKPHLKTGD